MDSLDTQKNIRYPIGAGSACFLAEDASINDDPDADFFEWLRPEGFASWGHHGHYSNIDRVYVNINSKVYAPGMPGIPITSPVGGHAVTLDEFMVIYGMCLKYKGKAPLDMSGGQP